MADCHINWKSKNLTKCFCLFSGLDHDHHVHFDVNQSTQVSSEIVVKSESKNGIAVHLGFLQLNHVYDVTFPLKDDLNEDLYCDPLQNLYVKVTQVMPSEDG